MCRPLDNNDPLPERFVLVTNFRTHNSQLTTQSPQTPQLATHNFRPDLPDPYYALFPLSWRRYFTQQNSVKPENYPNSINSDD